MKAVYEASYAIPELGVEPGDLIVVRPSHPTNPLLVSRRHHRSRLVLLLDHLDHFRPIEISGAGSPEQAEDQLRQRLLQPLPLPLPSLAVRRPLRVVR